jgi:nicotinamide mononucleotide (NMN) deamidase PncC
MALQVCGQFSSHWGIGITGYATPVPESGNKLFAYFAIACNGKVRLTGRLRSDQKNPEEVQLNYTQAVLQKLLTLMK